MTLLAFEGPRHYHQADIPDLVRLDAEGLHVQAREHLAEIRLVRRGEAQHVTACAWGAVIKEITIASNQRATQLTHQAEVVHA